MRKAMIKQILIFTISGIAILFTTLVWSYDTKLAESYAELFSEVKGKNSGKAMHFVIPHNFIKDIKAGKEIVVIDVRTPSETELFSMTSEKNLKIPANEIFKPENLARIPTDKQVMVICKSGARATAIGTALRHIGFDNVHILKGGFQDLSSYYGARQANQKPKQW